jgi:hypothetical protein
LREFFAEKAVMLSAEADAVLTEILATSDVAEIFVRAFRWAMRRTSYVMHCHHIVEGTARDTFWWKDSYREFAGMLRNAALPRMCANPDTDSRTLLPDDLADWIREEVRNRLMRVEDVDVFPVLLGLMDAIDRVLCELLTDDFYRRANGGSAASLDGRRPFPKPIAALGSRDLSWQHRQHPRGELPEYLEMEQYFGRLSVSAREPSGYTRSLHTWSENGDGARPWRIAVASVLADLGELEWEKPNGKGDRRFWATSYQSPEVRAAIVKRLIRVMDVCRRYETDLILIPELNLDGDMEALLLNLLAERKQGPGTLHPMVIGGCLHEPAPGEARAFRNRPAVLTPRGAVPWGYHKVAGADWDGDKEALCELPPEIVAIDTPIGRIAIALCLDFLAKPVAAAIADLRSSVVVVLSMTSGPSVNLFTNQAAELAASSHAVTVFCNSSVLLRPPHRSETGPWTLGFLYPHTTGTARPLCTHDLEDVESVAMVAVYEVKYCTKKGLIGDKLAEEKVSRSDAAALVLPPLQQIGGTSADAFPTQDPDGGATPTEGPSQPAKPHVARRAQATRG